MNYEELDILYRSRKTLLEILKTDGYDTKNYENFGPWEIEAMVAGGQTALTMDIKRSITEPTEPIQRCIVVYSLQKLKQRLNTFLSILKNSTEPKVDPATTEIVVVVLEDVADVFHAAALAEWSGSKLRIRFFKAHNLLFDPRTHVLVPKHTKMPAAEHAEFLKQHYIRSKANLPFIKFHEDMIARIMGLVPGDIVKITRPSPASGVYDMYRVCMP
jgi:DNA-directed RNA polymerase subunit H (RpoH/RPB5)